MIRRKKNIAGFYDEQGRFRPIRSPQYVGAQRRRATGRDKRQYSRAKAGDLGERRQTLAREDVFDREIRLQRESEEAIAKDRAKLEKEILRDLTAGGGHMAGRKPQTLSQFVRGMGGINTELRIKRGRKQYGDLENFTYKDSGMRGLVTTKKGKGKSLDGMHQAALEAGFNIGSIDGLLDALDEEIRSGKPTYATHGFIDYRDNPDGRRFWTVDYEKRVGEEYENDFQVFDDEDKARRFAEDVESARMFESDRDGNPIRRGTRSNPMKRKSNPNMDVSTQLRVMQITPRNWGVFLKKWCLKKGFKTQLAAERYRDGIQAKARKTRRNPVIRDRLKIVGRGKDLYGRPTVDIHSEKLDKTFHLVRHFDGWDTTARDRTALEYKKPLVALAKRLDAARNMLGLDRKKRNPSASRMAKSAIAIFDSDLDLDLDTRDVARLKTGEKILRRRRKAKAKRNPDSGFVCLECGHKFRSVAAAEKAAFGDEGCPDCDGSDINFDYPDSQPKSNPAKRNPVGWFRDVDPVTAEAIKKLYHKLAKRYHPDLAGGDLRAMQEINADYDRAMKIAAGNEKSEFRADSERQGATPLREAIQFAVTLPDDAKIVIRGLWLWLEGPGTYRSKDRIKSFVSSDGKKFKFASKKKAWFFAAVPSSNRRKEMSFAEIEALHGREDVTTERTRPRSLNPVPKMSSNAKKVWDLLPLGRGSKNAFGTVSLGNSISLADLKIGTGLSGADLNAALVELDIRDAIRVLPRSRYARRYNWNPAVDVGREILNQLGGNKFIVMTGAKNFGTTGKNLTFRLPSNFARDGINYVIITLTPADTYDVEYGKIRAYKKTVVAVSKGIYAEDLRRDFTAKTGLDTSMGRIIRNVKENPIHPITAFAAGASGILSALQIKELMNRPAKRRGTTKAKSSKRRKNPHGDVALHEREFDNALKAIERGNNAATNKAKLQGKLAGYSASEISYLIQRSRLAAKLKRNPAPAAIAEATKLVGNGGRFKRFVARHKAASAFKKELRLEAALERTRKKKQKAIAEATNPRSRSVTKNAAGQYGVSYIARSGMPQSRWFKTKASATKYYNEVKNGMPRNGARDLKLHLGPAKNPPAGWSKTGPNIWRLFGSDGSLTGSVIQHGKHDFRSWRARDGGGEATATLSDAKRFVALKGRKAQSKKNPIRVKLYKFYPGQKLATRMIGDNDIVIRATIVSRTPKFVTFQEQGEKRTKRAKVYQWGDSEYFYPDGQYSMASSFRAKDDDVTRSKNPKAKRSARSKSFMDAVVTCHYCGKGARGRRKVAGKMLPLCADHWSKATANPRDSRKTVKGRRRLVKKAGGASGRRSRSNTPGAVERGQKKAMRRMASDLSNEARKSRRSNPKPKHKFRKAELSFYPKGHWYFEVLNARDYYDDAGWIDYQPHRETFFATTRFPVSGSGQGYKETKTLAAAKKFLIDAVSKAHKKNPAKPPRSRTFEMFQGRKPTTARPMIVSRHAPAKLVQLGDLVELKLAGERPIKFNPSTVKLCCSNGKLWIAGKRFAKADPSQGATVLNPIAEIDHVVYRTYKPHHGDAPGTHYIHKLGEESGRRPFLAVDRDGFPVIRGGNYKIEARGIVD
jgi:hypothetical protein